MGVLQYLTVKVLTVKGQADATFPNETTCMVNMTLILYTRSYHFTALRLDNSA